MIWLSTDRPHVVAQLRPLSPSHIAPHQVSSFTASSLEDFPNKTPGFADLPSKFSGPRPWYFLLHELNEFENEIGCPISIFASPVGNRSIITSDVYIISNNTHVIIPGYATNWNSSGYFEVNDANSIWTGQFNIIAVDYDRYVIFNFHPFYTNEKPLYVGYRTSRPDKETVEEVKQKLQENNIDESQLEDWPADHCQVPESSTEEESSD